MSRSMSTQIRSALVGISMVGLIVFGSVVRSMIPSWILSNTDAVSFA